MKTWPLAVAAGAGLFAHVAPAATWLDRPTTTLLPRLKGVGRPDHVAITFDDGPDPKSTPRFLDELDRLGWTATFFLLGEMARAAPDLVVEIAGRGHEIALHGDRHRSHLLMTPAAVRRDLNRGVATLSELTGRPPTWFRVPYGELALASVIEARRLGLQPILWSAWGSDWREGATGASVAETVMAGFRPGSTILLHDSDCTSTPGSWRATLAALPILAERLAPFGSVGPLRDHFRNDTKPPAIEEPGLLAA